MLFRSLAALFLAFLMVLTGLNGCRARGQDPVPGTSEGPANRILHVASNGWHTAIIVRRDAIRPRVIPEAQDFPDSTFLEFGWGDREYYPNPRPSIGDALAAGLVPTDSVIHLAGLDAPPRDGGGLEMLELRITESGLERLSAALGADFDRGDAARTMPMSRGLVANSHFYPAHGTFHLFNTCNTWIAEKLAIAGIDIATSGIITADGLMERLRPLVTEKVPSPSPP